MKPKVINCEIDEEDLENSFDDDKNSAISFISNQRIIGKIKL